MTAYSVLPVSSAHVFIVLRANDKLWINTQVHTVCLEFSVPNLVPNIVNLKHIALVFRFN